MEKITKLAEELYVAADNDMNGSIDYAEARALLINIGQHLTKEESDKLIYLCDADSDGRIDFNEFKQLLYICSVADATDFVETVFYSLDMNLNGSIGITELKANRQRILKFLGDYSTDQLISKFKGQSKIKCGEFAKTWTAIMENGRSK